MVISDGKRVLGPSHAIPSHARPGQAMSQPISVSFHFFSFHPPCQLDVCSMSFPSSALSFTFAGAWRMRRSTEAAAAAEAEAIIKWAELRSSLPRVQRTHRQCGEFPQVAPVPSKLWWVSSRRVRARLV